MPRGSCSRCSGPGCAASRCLLNPLMTLPSMPPLRCFDLHVVSELPFCCPIPTSRPYRKTSMSEMALGRWLCLWFALEVGLATMFGVVGTYFPSSRPSTSVRSQGTYRGGIWKNTGLHWTVGRDLFFDDLSDGRIRSCQQKT